MWLLLRGDPNTVTHFARLILLVGMVLIGVSVWLDFPGVITGTFAVGLGASGACLEKWRTESGLWMFAVLCLLLYVFIQTCFILGEFNDVIRGAAPVEFGLAVDAAIAATLLSAQLRFLWAVFKVNIAITQSSDGG